MPVTDDAEEFVLKKKLCIYYLVKFQEEKIRALLNSGSKINAMSSAYIKKLDFKTIKTNVGAQKIDSLTLKIFEIVTADF